VTVADREASRHGRDFTENYRPECPYWSGVMLGGARVPTDRRDEVVASYGTNTDS
jgi:hypothetical protein